MLDLIPLCENKLSRHTSTEQLSRSYPNGTKQGTINFDTHTTQSSFKFTKEPTVIFLKNSLTLEPADYYDYLPEVNLTNEEEEARLRVVVEQKNKNPRFMMAIAWPLSIFTAKPTKSLFTSRVELDNELDDELYKKECHH